MSPGAVVHLTLIVVGGGGEIVGYSAWVIANSQVGLVCSQNRMFCPYAVLDRYLLFEGQGRIHATGIHSTKLGIRVCSPWRAGKTLLMRCQTGQTQPC